MDTVIQFLQNPKGQRFLTLIVAIAITIIVTSVVKRIIPKYISETQTRYRARKFVNFLGYFIAIVIVMIVYSNQLTGFSVFLGVAGAGIAFALQEVIASIAGFIAINTSNFFKVGDRVLLGGIRGDVIDISMLRTSLMETGDWVHGDLYNGRIVRVANSFIFKEPVFNYSGDFPFLWDEIKVPIKTSSDFTLAKKMFYGILNEIQGRYAEEAQQHWKRMTRKMMLENAKVEPSVHMMFDENWITFILRYVVDYKARRTTKDKISTKILESIQKTDGKIEIASAAFEITAFPHKGQ